MFGGRRVARRTARRTSRRQMAMYQDQGGGGGDSYDEPVAAAPPEPDPMEQLEKLAQLHAQGILTDEEFAAQKAKILG